MMTLIFTLLFLAIILGWLGYKRSALSLFAVAFIFASLLFYHQITDHTFIQL